MPDLLAWLAAVLSHPGLAWMLIWTAISAVLVGIVSAAWWLTGWLSVRFWRWRHPPIKRRKQ